MQQNHNGQDLPPAFFGLGEDQQQLCATLDLADACNHKITPTAHWFWQLALHLLGCFSSSLKWFVKNHYQIMIKIIGLMMIGQFFGWLVLRCIHSMTSENHSKSTKLNPLAHCHIQNLIFTIPVALPPPHPPPKNNREHTNFFALKNLEAGFMQQNHNGQDPPPAFLALVKTNNSFVEPWTWMMHAIIKSYQLLTGFHICPSTCLAAFHHPGVHLRKTMTNSLRKS